MHAKSLKPKGTVKIQRIAVPKAQDVLANQLRESILNGEIPEGQSLPSERELVEQTGLSRGAVREALKTLSVEGLIYTKQGRFGGNIVTLPGRESMATAINHFVHGRKIPLRSLQETREALEPYLARLAAERRSEEQLAELEQLHESLVARADSFHEFTRVNVKWHNAVARASGNELLATLLYSLSTGVHVATTAEEYDTPETRRQVMAIHARVNDAIKARNPDLAERFMRQHISASHARPLSIASSDIPLTDKNIVLERLSADGRQPTEK